MNKKIYDQRSALLLRLLEKTLYPVLKVFFRPKITGLENIPDEKILMVSNHNVGALIESHLLLFLYDQKTNGRKIFGFTHPSLFLLPLIKHYFLWIGSVPATYEMAKEVFTDDHSLLIFPGGNEQALRPIWKYRENTFRKSHGWAKIAIANQVKVVPVTYKYTHFVNPVIVSSALLSKILILPLLLGVRISSVTLSQIIFSLGVFLLGECYQLNLYLNLFITFWTFILVSLIPIFPIGIEVTIHPSLDPMSIKSQDELEDKVEAIYNSIY